MFLLRHSVIKRSKNKQWRSRGSTSTTVLSPTEASTDFLQSWKWLRFFEWQRAEPRPRPRPRPLRACSLWFEPEKEAEVIYYRVILKWRVGQQFCCCCCLQVVTTFSGNCLLGNRWIAGLRQTVNKDQNKTNGTATDGQEQLGNNFNTGTFCSILWSIDWWWWWWRWW